MEVEQTTQPDSEPENGASDKEAKKMLWIFTIVVVAILVVILMFQNNWFSGNKADPIDVVQEPIHNFTFVRFTSLNTTNGNQTEFVFSLDTADAQDYKSSKVLHINCENQMIHDTDVLSVRLEYGGEHHLIKAIQLCEQNRELIEQAINIVNSTGGDANVTG